MIRTVAPKPGTHRPAEKMRKLDPQRDLARLLPHVQSAITGDNAQVRQAVAVSLRVGLLHGSLGDLSLAAAVVAERITVLDDTALAGVYGAAHHETRQRMDEPLKLKVKDDRR
ncbi:MAG: hypothetical protein AAGA29_04945 [Planctomycetota bacterium]